jgi:Flp pilus assembly protein TadD
MVIDRETTRWTLKSLRAALAGGVSYVGQLADLSHDDFVEAVEQHGGRYVRYSNHAHLSAIVVGAAGLPVLSNGELTPLPSDRLISESQFTRLLGWDVRKEQDVYTTTMSAQLLGVPEARISAWAKAGLIQPVRVDHGVMWFEFRQLAVARTLSDLTASGVTVGQLRRTLRQLQQKMPDLKEPLQQLTILEHNGPLLVRLECGELSEVTGQMHLGFDDQPQPQPVQLRLIPSLVTAADWHEQGVEQERAGMLAEAEESYRQALRVGGPDAQMTFDLACVLTKLGKTLQAIERLQQVLELDPEHADAWNNLGIILSETGELRGACEALRYSLRISPDDPKAHFNLADTLEMMGLEKDAQQHWRMYLRHDPAGSTWANHARARLRSSS